MMEHSTEMGGYNETPNVQNGSNYITIIPVEYTRRGYPIPNEYQYSEYRTREEYYNLQTQKLQAEVNAHLYSVSQRLPQLSSYSPIGRHNDWDKHSDIQKSLQKESKESNSSDSLEKSVMGSNLSSCSNGTASSSTVTAASSSYGCPDPGAASPPLLGSSGSTASSSTCNSHSGIGSLGSGPSCTVMVYVGSKTAIAVAAAAEEPAPSATRVLHAVLASEELGLLTPQARALAANVFSLWMCSPLLEVQLRGTQCPWRVWRSWRALVSRHGHGSPERLARDHPVLRLRRNVFYSKHLEETIKDWRIQELLYEEAKYNVVAGRYPVETTAVFTLAGLQARIQLGPFDQNVHTTQFFRQNQAQFLPKHAQSGRWRRLFPLGKAGPEARLLEQMQRHAPSAAAAATPAVPQRKMRVKYSDFCRALPFYGAAFFQGQMEQPFRSLGSLLTREDVPVLLAVNAVGIFVIDDSECRLLLGLRYEELSWELGLPSDESNEESLACIFLQFMVVENGLRVSKLLQVFSRQAVMADTLIEHFAGEYRKRIGADSPRDHTQYDYHSESGNSELISLPPLFRADSPHRRVCTKLSRLPLATHDARGHWLGGVGLWHQHHEHHQGPLKPLWTFPNS